ncbi:MAG: alkaline phosphatase [Gammaproteobacteria bacterium]|nr:alkaline phosphatase [Gammaproteobacteria bacterium]
MSLRKGILKNGWALLFFSQAILAGAPSADVSPGVKNIILLIGDGMGPQQIGFLVQYAHNAPNSIYQGRQTSLEKMMREGRTILSLTHPAHALVVDSACSATQLATGVFSGSEMIGLDADGNPVETILERAEKLGKSTGLVSDTRITHATPAAFATHQAHRSSENEIAEELLRPDVDLMLSGGLRHWLAQSVNQKKEAYSQAVALTGGTINIYSKRKDEKNLLAVAKKQGYALVFNRGELKKTPAETPKLLGLFSASQMPDGILHHQTELNPKRTVPTLQELVVKSLEILSQNEKGFFLMVEGGQIDWAAHNNDAGTLLHEMVKFDEAIKVVYEWAKGREDTLVILTADHETGGFGLSYSRKDTPKPTVLPGKAFASKLYKPEFNFGAFALLDKIYQQGKSFEALFSEFDGLPETAKNPMHLMHLVNENSMFKITGEEAARILTVEPNDYYQAEHAYLGIKEYPKINDFKEFYVYGNEARTALLARALAKDQNVVWATGTHTDTPVTVTFYGRASQSEALSGIVHHKDVGQYMRRLLS